MRLFYACLLVLGLCSTAVSAQVELSIYGGTALVSDSQIRADVDGLPTSVDLTSGWTSDNNSGLRLTYWQNDQVGFGFDLNTANVTAKPEDIAGSGLDAVGFGGNASLLTINAYRRWEQADPRVTPYIGAGLGVSIPVATLEGGTTSVNSRRATGPAMQVIAGARYSIANNLSVFGEVQSSYAINAAEFESGSTLETTILSNGLNFGIALGF